MKIYLVLNHKIITILFNFEIMNLVNFEIVMNLTNFENVMNLTNFENVNNLTNFENVDNLSNFENVMNLINFENPVWTRFENDWQVMMSSVILEWLTGFEKPEVISWNLRMIDRWWETGSKCVRKNALEPALYRLLGYVKEKSRSKQWLISNMVSLS